MSFALRVLFGLALLLSASLAHAQEQRFTHTGVQADAKRYETYLRANWQPGKKTARELRAEGRQGAGRQHRSARRLAGLRPGGGCGRQ